jgi:hypothetical protein
MEFRCYCVGPMPGYGFNSESLRLAMELKPDCLASQGTSTDIGPWYLGTGEQLSSLTAIERDLELLITTAVQNHIPFIVSVGGAGNDKQLKDTIEIIERIAARLPRPIKLAAVSGELTKQYLKTKLHEGVEISSIAGSARIADPLTESMVEESGSIVAQVGAEVIQKALSLDVDGVVAGRSLDAGLFAALPLTLGFEPATARGFGQLLNDGGVAATPMAVDGMFGILHDDAFDLVPTNPNFKCTPASVMAAAIRERDDPSDEIQPGGTLGFQGLQMQQLPDGRSVRVSGFSWTPAPYTVKLEGVRLSGYRSVVIGGMRDPVNISNLQTILSTVKSKVSSVLGMAPNELQLDFITYGLDGVLGRLEPLRGDAKPHEIGIVADIIAETQAEATSIAKLTRSSLLHCGYPGRKSTEGNLALPFAPTEIEVGPVYVWNIWHALPLTDPLEPFKIDVITVGQRQ